jgi:hypothetical protein
MNPDSKRRVECWCRSLAATPDGPQAEVVERLEWLAADRVVDEVSVETWPAVVPADRTWALGEHERRIHDRLSEFEAWADREGCALRGAFGDRRTGNPYTATHVDEVRVLPLVALAEYRDGDLWALSPVVENGATFRVEDHLEALSRGHESRAEPVLATSD